jgi:hypothetical protein
MSDETHDTQSADETPQPDESGAVAYSTSARTRYILIGVIIVLAFAVSYGIAQARSAPSDDLAAQSGAGATAAGSAQAAGGG